MLHGATCKLHVARLHAQECNVRLWPTSRLTWSRFDQSA